MGTNDDNPPHDSREGLPVYEGADQPDDGRDVSQAANGGDGSLGQDTTPEHDNREADQTYQEAPPAGSGGADSFDSRHNEFDEGEGQPGAGIDPQTGEAVHGDGLAHEHAEETRSTGFDAEQPQQVQDAGDEPNAEQPREQH
ncbi:hypothetical protein ABIB37_001813 [Agrococcus sp. UYP10]|uniref:hypothetical protein n=1 Tax=Agrococcus sp. UYP10 TaxID=1756355 RepID=UPI003399327B